MVRYKTYDATGIAPNGRLYAGDMNAIQDAAAALADFAQVLDLGTLRVGETGLTVSRIGAGEAQVAGKLKVTQMLTGLGGLLSGTYTTTQRNAIVSPPYGLIILNSTTNQLEINIGTPGTPNWQGLVMVNTIPASVSWPIGGICDWPNVTPPTNHLICNGQAISRATYATLYGLLGTTYGIGDGSTTFNIPDFRGRVAVGLGTHADVTSLGSNEGAAVGARRPKHKHTAAVIDPGHGHTAGYGGNANAPQLSQYIFTNGNSGTGVPIPANVTGISITVGPQTGNEPVDSEAYLVLNKIIRAL